MLEHRDTETQSFFFSFLRILNARLQGRKGFILNLCVSVSLCSILVLASCARMGQPDGGWYDETPPKIIGCSPAEKATNVKSRRVLIHFNEYIKVDNPTDNITISPPQLEAPDIKTTGKGIRVSLKDSLKANTTYTIDFSDAITDNNESNPLGNYTYVFSTGDQVDTMEVAGYVLNAEDLEPVKGIHVGLYKVESEKFLLNASGGAERKVENAVDSDFIKYPMLRVARTDGSGHFIIRGVASGKYRIYGLQDSDGDYKLSQRGEPLAFSHDIIVPSQKDDYTQDTTWVDKMHIKGITRKPYIHYLPDDVVLRSFTQIQTDRYFVKAERKEANNFSICFSYGSPEKPKIRPLNFPENSRIITESSQKNDSIIYWLADSALINQDTLMVEMQYMMTDTLGGLVSQTDTLELLSKQPYAKRMKAKEEAYKKWKKEQDKKKKKEEPYETEMPQEFLEPNYNIPSTMTPLTNIQVEMPVPLESIDTSMIHIYAKHDTLWYRSPMRFTSEGLPPRTYQIQGEWRTGTEYSVEVDSACFRDIYGRVSRPFSQGVKIPEDKEFSTIILTYSDEDTCQVIMQLLQSDKVVSEAKVRDHVAEFYYVKPGEYYLRIIVDSNNNGIWDTGDYSLDRLPEMVYYWPEKIKCEANWDLTKTINPRSTPLYRQKPAEITKQKAEKKQQKTNRNAERAAEKGIVYKGKG